MTKDSQEITSVIHGNGQRFTYYRNSYPESECLSIRVYEYSKERTDKEKNTLKACVSLLSDISQSDSMASMTVVIDWLIFKTSNSHSPTAPKMPVKLSVRAMPDTKKQIRLWPLIWSVSMCSSACLIRIYGFISTATVDTKKHE